MRLTTLTRWALACALTTLALAATSAGAAASTGFSITNGIALTNLDGNVTLSLGARTSSCSVSLSLALEPSIAKVPGAPAASLLPTPFSVAVRCDFGEAITFLAGSFTYRSFTGTLPYVTSIIVRSVDSGWHVKDELRDCLFEGGTLDIELHRNPFSSEIEMASVSGSLPGSGASWCSDPLSLRGTLVIPTLIPDVELV